MAYLHFRHSSITIISGSIAVSRQTWCWWSSWEPYILETVRKSIVTFGVGLSIGDLKAHLHSDIFSPTRGYTHLNKVTLPNSGTPIWGKVPSHHHKQCRTNPKKLKICENQNQQLLWGIRTLCKDGLLWMVYFRVESPIVRQERIGRTSRERGELEKNLGIQMMPVRH